MATKKKILVTGAGGFVGPHLIRELQNNLELDIYASIYSETSDLATLLPSDHLIKGDLTDLVSTDHLIATVMPDTIYHLAALSVVHNSVEQAGKVLTNNLILQYNLLESVVKHVPQCRVVAIGSAHEYGLVKESEVPITESQPLRPLNPYAVSKLSQEMLTLQYHYAKGLDAVMLRPFNHTGEGQTTDFVIPALAKQFAEISSGVRPATIQVGNLDSIRDFTDVLDMVKAYVLAGEKGIAGEVYNIGFGKGITIRQIITLFEEMSGHHVTVTTREESARGVDIPVLICDASKFRTLTGWQPQIKFKDTVARVYNYMSTQL